ncbi:MAG TPA: carbamoyltransferase C-terminal domain-containing protein, partial [Candidatus Dormibacteraeota bacterium]|nr:carbamoyltransferase C-terminal domain-containing protein [Candidatus Dormibacteraeota bacterium]
IGINYSQMHDSSACIVRDGELLFAVAEERISRVKHDAGFPKLAIQACLDFARVTAQQIDEVCFGWQRPGATYRHDLRLFASGKLPIGNNSGLSSTLHFLSMTRQRGGAKRFEQTFGATRARMRFVDHHLAHALSAFAYSGFDDAAVVVMDGRGAFEATSIWHGRDGRLEHVLTIPFPDSVGFFYSEFTEFLGFHRNSDEWKVMGLAPYGQPGVDLRAFIEVDAGTENAPCRVHSGMLMPRGGSLFPEMIKRFGAARVDESEITQRDKNIAFAVQDACEAAMMSVVRVAMKKTGSRNLCMAGGVALNSKANGKIAASGLIDKIFVQPAASDDGVALGAAMAPYLDGGGKLPKREMRNAYLGTWFDDEVIEAALRTYKLKYTRVTDPAEPAADLLAQGKILGWFQGRMEFGPRALGARSILADPRDPEMNAKVNNAVKFREWWRPFAPSFKKEIAGEYLESATDSPFMILTAQVRPEKRAVIPSVTHVDGSARPQTVEKEVNPVYWRLIDGFGRRTGVPVVMNTSFNLRGEAIVNTPTDAIRTFFSSGMDYLVIGNFVVEK